MKILYIETSRLTDKELKMFVEHLLVIKGNEANNGISAHTIQEREHNPILIAELKGNEVTLSLVSRKTLSEAVEENYDLICYEHTIELFKDLTVGQYQYYKQPAK